MPGTSIRPTALVDPLIGTLRPGTLRALALNLLAGIWIYRRSFEEAAAALKDAVRDAEENIGVLVADPADAVVRPGQLG